MRCLFILYISSFALSNLSILRWLENWVLFWRTSSVSGEGSDGTSHGGEFHGGKAKNWFVCKWRGVLSGTVESDTRSPPTSPSHAHPTAASQYSLNGEVGSHFEAEKVEVSSFLPQGPLGRPGSGSQFPGFAWPQKRALIALQGVAEGQAWGGPAPSSGFCDSLLPASSHTC